MNEVIDYEIISVEVKYPFKDKQWYKLKNAKTGIIYCGVYTNIAAAELARSNKLIRGWNVNEIGPTTRREILLNGGELETRFYTSINKL